MSIRHLTKSKYNAHTYPLFKRMNILTISDLFYLFQLKNDVPKYFKHSFFVTNEAIRGRYTRNRSSISIPRVRHTFAKNIIRHSIPNVINNTDRNIIGKLHTHSFDSFAKYAKKMFIAKYD